ncbi:MBD C domain containing protein [Trichuris trichiura]|uniref:MBD C domain containing protein n=1 Tax=Trichuris trichiura TaxID=36087 RepID=A0A077YWK1_TRITR|nr:MBD C domain containing protein [Trichuris trichiura]
MARSKQGKAKGVRHKGGKGRGSVAKYVASSSRHGFDGSVSPPRRQTASVLRQPVTVFSTSSEETKPAPPTEIKRAFGRLTKPFQLFCFKRLQGYRAMTFRDPEDPTTACPELVSPPNKIFPVGPGVDEEVACLSLCSALQNFSKGLPVTGQTGPKKALESNPNVNFNPDQPLIQAVMISEEDIMMQERRVLDARRRLEEALKHFG